MEFAPEFENLYWDLSADPPTLRPIDTEEETEPDESQVVVGDEAAFNEWVRNRTVGYDNYGHCNMDIYTEWHNAYYLFAGHNCGIYDLTLKLFFSKSDFESKKWVTEDAKDEGCEPVASDPDTICCKYFLTP